MALALGDMLERASTARVPVFVNVGMLEYKIFDENSVL